MIKIRTSSIDQNQCAHVLLCQSSLKPLEYPIKIVKYHGLFSLHLKVTVLIRHALQFILAESVVPTMNRRSTSKKVLSNNEIRVEG